MRGGISSVVGVAAVLAGAAGLGALSRVPYRHAAGTNGVLRLAWRVRSVRVDVCRHRTPEELARLPVHMREDEVCTRQLLPYRLRVTVDDSLLADEIVRAAGAREDRPLYVFRQFALQPGTHRVSVHFDRQGDAPEEAEEGHPEEHGDPRAAAPASLVLGATVRAVAGEIQLITYEEDSRRLVVRSGVGVQADLD